MGHAELVGALRGVLGAKTNAVDHRRRSRNLPLPAGALPKPASPWGTSADEPPF